MRHLIEDDEEPLKLGGDGLATVRRYAIAVKNAGEAGLLEWVIVSCVEAQQSIKTGKETPEMALTLLTLRLCGLDRLNAG